MMLLFLLLLSCGVLLDSATVTAAIRSAAFDDALPTAVCLDRAATSW